MPRKKYDRYFGGTGGAEKAHAAMMDQYDDKTAERVFYATMNRNKSKKPMAKNRNDGTHGWPTTKQVC